MIEIDIEYNGDKCYIKSYLNAFHFPINLTNILLCDIYGKSLGGYYLIDVGNNGLRLYNGIRSNIDYQLDLTKKAVL